MMSLAEALAGKEIPEDIKKDLRLVSIPYVSFDGNVSEGRLVVHSELAMEVQELFKKLFESRFPIHSIIPIAEYNWDDDASMAANNSSAFNYRLIAGTDRLSNHSFGRAIDINPVQNPYCRRDGPVMPHGAQYDVTEPGTITNEIAALFKSRGWKWGGDWESLKDWQHFEKPESKT